jgi:hypothetical protein
MSKIASAAMLTGEDGFCKSIEGICVLLVVIE